MSQPGFFDLDNRYESISKLGDPLEVLDQSIPWETFRLVMSTALRKFKKSNAGRKPYDSVFMFKILVLQSLYNLSDDLMARLRINVSDVQEVVAIAIGGKMQARFMSKTGTLKF
jgi:hypothetical protein